MPKPIDVPHRFGPHGEFPGQGNAYGRPDFVDGLRPFSCLEESIDIGTLATPEVLDASRYSYCFTDDVTVLTHVIITGFGPDDVIKLTGLDRDFYNYSTAPDDPSDLWITYNDGVNFTEIRLDNVLTGGPVFDYASAMASVGYDFLESFCVEVSIDIGAPLTPEIIDASPSDFCFTDNALAETNVVLENFGLGDKIEVSGATEGDYNFARDFDDINDLVITYSLGPGMTNRIVIDDVLPDAGDLDNSYAGARAFVGYDFMTFG